MILEDLDETDYCLNAGGDVVCRAAVAGSAPWWIGIEDPADPTRLVARVEARSGGVATSSSAHRGDHIVDARTGRSPTYVASVTVIAADLVSADIDATAAYAMGPDALDWLRSRPGRRGLVVWRDGTQEPFG